jgi:hypothetical protein
MPEAVVKGLFWRKIEVRRGGSEDLKHGTNPAEKGGRPKDIFEVGSSVVSLKFL